MTLLALPAELAEVNVILLVTCSAIPCELNFRGRFAMALRALELFVCACQRELGPRMVELP